MDQVRRLRRLGVVLSFVPLAHGCGGEVTFGGVNARTTSADAIKVTAASSIALPAPPLPQAPTCELEATPAGPIREGDGVSVAFKTIDGTVTSARIDDEPAEVGLPRSVILDKPHTFKGRVDGKGALSGRCELTVDVTPLATRTLMLVGKTTAKPVDLIFLVDDSGSMKDELQRLKDSIKLVPEKLNAEKVNYTLRVLPMSSFDGSNLADAGGGIRTTPNYRKGEGRADFSPYADRKVYTPSDYAGIADEIGGLGQGRIVSEPGLCLIADYTGFVLDKLKPTNGGLGKNLHIVVMSDEANDVRFRTEDPVSGAILSDNALSCPFEKGGDPVCMQKASLYYTWYHYKWQPYRYRGTRAVTTVGACQTRGDLQADAPVGRVRSTKFCRQKKYDCQNQNHPATFACEVPGGPSIAGDRRGWKSCELAQKFDCTRYADGQPFTVPNVPRALVAGTCTPSADSAYIRADVDQGGTFGIKAGSCQNYACNVTSFHNVVATESQKASYTNCTERVGDFAYTSKHASVVSGGWITAITESACGAYATEVTLAAQNLSGTLCGIDAGSIAYPDGTEYYQTGTTTTVTTNVPVETEDRTSPLTEAQFYANYNASANFTTMRPDRYYYRAAESAAESAALPGGSLVSSVVRARQDDARAIAFKGAVGDAAASGHATEVVEADGLTCKMYGPSQDKDLPPTHENFLASMKNLYPERSFVLHSIVNTDGQPCPGAGDVLQARGDGYIEVSAATGGVVGDICKSDFSDFLKVMTDTVKNEVETDYPDALDGIGMLPVTSIVNKRTGEELLPTKVEVKAGRLVFLDKTALQIGDELQIAYEP